MCQTEESFTALVACVLRNVVGEGVAQEWVRAVAGDGWDGANKGVRPLYFTSKLIPHPEPIVPVRHRLMRLFVRSGGGV